MTARHAAALRRGAAALLSLLAAAVLAGCAAPGSRLPEGSVDKPLPAVHLQEVAFFPQSRYQCGPAALATVLTWSGVETDPAALKPRVYVPERQGSLQSEMLATARAEGRLAYPVHGGLDALAAELDAGHPVLVMQNLGLTWLPQWHYAVAVGLEPGRGSIILRSGRDKQRRTPLGTFERTWRRSGHWGFVTLQPGRMPATAKADTYLRASRDLENTAGAAVALPAYRAGAERWTRDPRFPLAAANALYALNRLPAAAITLEQGLEANPESALLYNNLAMVRLHAGQPEAAYQAAVAGLLDGDGHRPVLYDTLAQVRCRRLPPPGEPRPCPE